MQDNATRCYTLLFLHDFTSMASCKSYLIFVLIHAILEPTLVDKEMSTKERRSYNGIDKKIFGGSRN